MDFIVWILFFLLFIGMSAGIIIFFINSLVMLKKTPKDSENRSKRKNSFIVSSVLAVMLIIVVVVSFINADIILEGLFFGIPVGIIIFFIVSLVMWKKIRRTVKNTGQEKLLL
ncbi:MAG: hypothetical protein K2O29_04520 [Ruminococcus sp.]|nr:hypothetical protein [Ruminococcus sp.]